MPAAPLARPPVEPHDFWQDLLPAGTEAEGDRTGLWRDGWLATLPDRRRLWLPIRPLGDRPGFAVASLIVNQASFAVQDVLAHALAERLAAHVPEVIVGLPTLGLALAERTARLAGHARFVACGTSRKFWYDDALSVPIRSITSPGADKRLYLDPRTLPLLRGRRIALVDDAVSSGRSMRAGLALMAAAGVRPVCLGCAMRQTDDWKTEVDTVQPGLSGRTEGVFDSPLLARDASAEAWRTVVGDGGA